MRWDYLIVVCALLLFIIGAIATQTGEDVYGVVSDNDIVFILIGLFVLHYFNVARLIYLEDKVRELRRHG